MSVTIHKTEEVELIYFNDLSEDEKKDLSDYSTVEDSSFFRYCESVYDINDFMKLTGNYPQEFKGYDGYMSETFFSGVIIKLLDDEKLKVSSYYS